MFDLTRMPQASKRTVSGFGYVIVTEVAEPGHLFPAISIHASGSPRVSIHGFASRNPYVTRVWISPETPTAMADALLAIGYVRDLEADGMAEFVAENIFIGPEFDELTNYFDVFLGWGDGEVHLNRSYVPSGKEA